MANLNKVLLMGNLTRDVKLSYLPSNTPVAELGLAVNRTWVGQDGQKHEEATFVDLTMFGKRAEVLNKYLHKGDPLFVEGRLKLDTWDDKQTGQKRSRMRVMIEDFQFLGRAGGGGGPRDAAPAGAARESGPSGGARDYAPSGGSRRQPAPEPPADEGPGPDDYSTDATPAAGDDIPF